MPNPDYMGVQRSVYLSAELDEELSRYLAQHSEIGFSRWMRRLITEQIRKEAPCVNSAT